MREPATPTEMSREGLGGDTITEEDASPVSLRREASRANMGQDSQDKRVGEVIQATKRLLEIIRLRDFRAYE